MEFKGHYLIFPEKNKIVIYDMKNNKKVKELDKHFGNIVFLQLIGDKLISNSDDTAINIWDLKSGKLIYHFEPYLDKR